MFIKNLSRLMESPSAWAVLATTMRMGSGVILLPLLLRNISPEEVGVWYIFQSLGIITILFDFGLGGTITRAASALWAGAKCIISQGLPSGGTAAPNIAELGYLLGVTRKLYQYIVIVILLVLTMLSPWFVFSGDIAAHTSGVVTWAWWGYIVGAALGLRINGELVFLSGVGAMRQAQLVTVISQLIYLVISVVLVTYTKSIAGLVIAQLISICFSWFAVRRFLDSRITAARVGTPEVINALRVLWPNTWRLGVVSVGAYFINNATLLICALRFDVLTAGSYGLSLQLFSILYSLSITLINVQLPSFVAMRTAGQYALLRSRFGVVLLVAGFIFLCGGVAVIGFGQHILIFFGSETKILGSSMLLILGITKFLEFNHSSFSILVMTENRVPFVWPSIVSGLFIVVICWIVSSSWGLWALILVPACIQAAFNNWWTVVIGLRSLHCSGVDLMRASFSELRALFNKLNRRGHIE